MLRPKFQWWFSMLVSVQACTEKQLSHELQGGA